MLSELKAQALTIEELVQARVEEAATGIFSGVVLQHRSSNMRHEGKENGSPVTQRNSPLTPDLFQRKKASIRGQLSHSPILQDRKLVVEQPFEDRLPESPRVRTTAKAPAPHFGSARRNISFGVMAAEGCEQISLRQENLSLRNEIDMLRLQTEEDACKEQVRLREEIRALRQRDEQRKDKLRQIKENYRQAMEGVLHVTASIEKIETEARNVCDILRRLKLGEPREQLQEAIAHSLSRLSSIES